MSRKLLYGGIALVIAAIWYFFIAGSNQPALAERYIALQTPLLTQRYGPDFLGTLTGPHGGGPSSQPTPITNVDLDPALININRFFDRIVAALDEKDAAARDKALSQIDLDMKTMVVGQKGAGIGNALSGLFLSRKERGERLGNILIGLLTPVFRKVQASMDRNELNRRNLEAAFALAIYRQEQGAYPKALGDLVPKYIQEVPRDLYVDAPLTYKAEGEGYLLYSVGLDGHDDEGISREENPRMDDLVIRMPRPPRPKKGEDRE